MFREWWDGRWARYAGSGTDWPWRWKIIGACTSRLPGKSASWWMCRQFARERFGNIKAAWAEPYLLFWIMVHFIFEEDGIQYGHFYIVRKPRTVEDGYALAHDLTISTEAKILLESSKVADAQP